MIKNTIEAMMPNIASKNIIGKNAPLVLKVNFDIITKTHSKPFTNANVPKLSKKSYFSSLKNFLK